MIELVQPEDRISIAKTTTPALTWMCIFTSGRERRARGVCMCVYKCDLVFDVAPGLKKTLIPPIL